MTDEQLRAWTREAEEDYDVDALKHEHAQQRRKPLRDAHSHVDAPKPLEATGGGTHNEGSRSETLTAPLSGPQPKRAPPLTRGQRSFRAPGSTRDPGHPRSRGVNKVLDLLTALVRGSSPLTRGQQATNPGIPSSQAP